MLPKGRSRELTRTVRLGNGSAVELRLIRPDDESRLTALAGRLSRETVYQRFFAPMQRLSPEQAHFFANVDYRDRLAVVAEQNHGGEPALVAVARYDRGSDDIAEIALVVEDRWQRLGLGVILLDELVRAAEDRGVDRFRAYVLSDNRRMLGLLARHTEILTRQARDGVTELVFRRRAVVNETEARDGMPMSSQ
jgi:GNAT superfamily N-acetyltransferase